MPRLLLVLLECGERSPHTARCPCFRRLSTLPMLPRFARGATRGIEPCPPPAPLLLLLLSSPRREGGGDDDLPDLLLLFSLFLFLPRPAFRPLRPHSPPPRSSSLPPPSPSTSPRDTALMFFSLRSRWRQLDRRSKIGMCRGRAPAPPLE